MEAKKPATRSRKYLTWLDVANGVENRTTAPKKANPAVVLTSHAKKPKVRPVKMPTASESDILSAILTYLRVRRIFAWRNNNGAVFDPSRQCFRSLARGAALGVPDILGILPSGIFLGFEVKKKGEKPSPAQVDFISNAQKLGAIAHVVYSVDDVKDILDTYGCIS